MYGWRARIGLLLPSANVVFEPEFSKVLPEGVSAYSARMYNKKADLEDTIGLERDIERASKELSSTRPKVIGFCCTSGSLVKGKGWDKEIINRIQKVVNVPATTTTTASIKALSRFKVERVSIVTPYIADLDQKEKEFFEASGLKVLSIDGLGIEEAVEIGDVDPSEVYDFAMKKCSGEADGLFISCTNLRTIEILEVLERDLKRPVVSANQATMWDMLRLAGVADVISGYGKLLTTT